MTKSGGNSGLVTLTEEIRNGKLHFLCDVCSKRDSNAGFSCKFCENFESTFLTELKQSYNKVPSRHLVVPMLTIEAPEQCVKSVQS